MNLPLNKRKDEYSVPVDVLKIKNQINYLVAMQKNYQQMTKCYSQQEFAFEDISRFEQSKKNSLYIMRQIIYGILLHCKNQFGRSTTVTQNYKYNHQEV